MTEHAAALRPGTDVVVLYVRQPLECLAAHLEGDPALEEIRGDAADTIVRVADELNASLIVIGSRGRRRIASLVLGSISHHVVHQTGRPVLVVPSPSLAATRAQAIEGSPRMAETAVSA